MRPFIRGVPVGSAPGGTQVSSRHQEISIFPLHGNENPIYVFLFWELRSRSPNFHIHVSVNDLYIPRMDPHFPAAEYADRSWEYINRSQAHECGSWDCGRAIPFLVIFISNFQY